MRHRFPIFMISVFLFFLNMNRLLADEINPGVFRVMLRSCGSNGIGFVQTGFRAQWNGQQGIVTALHGVSWCGKYLATQGVDNKAIDLTDLALAAVDMDRDVAFLSSKQLAGVRGAALEKANYNTDRDRLKVIGYPDGVLSQISEELRYHENSLRPLGSWHQRVSDMCEKRRSPSCKVNVLLVAGEPLIPGHSGAPVFNQDGRVVGIAGGGLKGGFALLNWMIPYTDVHLLPVSQYTFHLNSLRQLDLTELFAAVSTIDENKYPAGYRAKISGKILYGGYNGPPIGVAANYSKASAVIKLFERETRKEVPVDYTYNNHTGEYSLNNVPPGKFGINVRLSGHSSRRAGDFISYLSGLNTDIAVAPHDKSISRDLKVVYSIHLKRPVDNQVERTRTTDPLEVLNRSQGLFEWEPVPGAAYYEVYLYLHDGNSDKTNRIVNPNKTSSTIFKTNLNVTDPNTKYMFRVAALDPRGSLIGHFSNYYKNGFGGWFEFRVR